ncbi:MAG: reverse transcriptase domain-containing protein, partial [Planctomycetota bacterium]|nr:reverse transcriptase domain-containing protein [Planctomycetota bacterium]
GVISPLLANIVLNHLDWKLHEAGYRFARYADDFVVVCQTYRQAYEALSCPDRAATSTKGKQDAYPTFWP